MAYLAFFQRVTKWKKIEFPAKLCVNYGVGKLYFFCTTLLFCTTLSISKKIETSQNFGNFVTFFDQSG